MPARVPYGDYRDFQPGGIYYDPEEFRRNEIERGNETGTFATHGGSLDEISAALAEMSRDRQVMELLRQGKTEKVESLLAERYGLSLPRHYALDIDNGIIVPREQGRWERWKTPILLTAAMFGGAFAAEAMMAGSPGVLPSTTIGEGYLPALNAGAGALPAAGTATAGLLPATVLPQAMTRLPSAASQVLEHTGIPGVTTVDELRDLLGLGSNADDLLPLILSSLAGLGAGAMQPDFFQERQSFSGTGADPVAWLTDARKAIGDAYNVVGARANEPTDLSGAQVTKPAGTSGGGFDFGLTASPDAVNASTRPRRPPLQFQPMPNTPSSGGDRRNPPPSGPAVPRQPSPPGRTAPPPRPGEPPRDTAIPRRNQFAPAGNESLEGMFNQPTGVQPQQGDSPGRASARLLLGSLMAQRQGGQA